MLKAFCLSMAALCLGFFIFKVKENRELKRKIDALIEIDLKDLSYHKLDP